MHSTIKSHSLRLSVSIENEIVDKQQTASTWSIPVKPHTHTAYTRDTVVVAVHFAMVCLR